jgi:hypothetical protein
MAVPGTSANYTYEFFSAHVFLAVKTGSVLGHEKGFKRLILALELPQFGEKRKANW